MTTDQNQYVKGFKSAIDKLKTVIIRADHRPVRIQKRVFNEPTTDEVDIIVVSHQQMLEIHLNFLQRITETHISYDALQYPLSFWARDDGYHFQHSMTNGRKLTAM